MQTDGQRLRVMHAGGGLRAPVRVTSNGGGLRVCWDHARLLAAHASTECNYTPTRDARGLLRNSCAATYAHCHPTPLRTPALPLPSSGY